MPALPNNVKALVDLNKRFGSMIRIASLAIEPGIKKSADQLVEKMKDFAPKDSGALAESIVATPAGETTPATKTGEGREVPKGHIIITAGNAEVDYAVETEHGTSKEEAEAFFYPPINSMRSDAIKANVRHAIASALIKGAIGKVLS